MSAAKTTAAAGARRTSIAIPSAVSAWTCV
jgi:hypothetical protein